MMFFSACNSPEENETQAKPIIKEHISQQKIDDSTTETTAADTSSTGVFQEEASEDGENLREAIKANSENIIKEEGLSFCDCVIKNKKLSEIIMADKTSDTDFDKAMKELEDMKTGPCKIMFPQQNNIEEQQAHQQKVKDCLNK